MTDQQCGLCLSCGAPFLPDIDDVDFFNREANLSILFLNTQFKRDPDIMRTYEVPKLCSQRQASHIVHVSYHQTALDYMCNRHRGDRDVGIGAAFGMGAHFVVPDVANAPFLYYHTATGNQGPKAATWVRPAANARIDMSPILNRLDRVYNGEIFLSPLQLGRVYDICAACNALMTQKSHMRFLLGCRNAGNKNRRGVIVPRDAFNQYNMETGRHALENGYGAWRVQNGVARRGPRRTKMDSDAPAIAYYLHMCLPFYVPGQVYRMDRFPLAERRRTRSLFLELCWVVLEIACLATLNEEGTATKPRASKKSHGQHQHLGVLDLYVSYFFWRLMVHCYGARGQLDFVQFHQKYFSDARNCPDLLSVHGRAQPTGTLMYRTSNMSGKPLVEHICANLMRYFNQELDPLIQLCSGGRGLPPEIEEYFLPFQVVRQLRLMSTQVCSFFVFAFFVPRGC